MKYNPKPYERRLKTYLARQMQSIDKLIDSSVGQIVRRTLLLSSVSNLNAQEDFFFKNYPALSNAVDGILAGLSNSLFGNIVTGIEWSWDLSNTKNDDMVSRLVRSIGANKLPSEAMFRWNQKNLPALEAFEERRIGGMSLSDKVWKYTEGMKGDIELALDLGLGEGMSADKLSRQVRGYLREPDRLYRRVRDEKGVLRLSKSASNYHPGQGVYRSSYKNAKRLAATETNMAYRSADHERNQQLDFILGIRINLSKNHTCLNSKGEPVPFFDICDELQGDYPKDFKFTGWHPNCRCYVTTILPDKDEFVQYLVSMDENGNSTYKFSGEVTDVPQGMKDWLENNEERLVNAKSLPYWIKDNPQILTSEEVADKVDYENLKGQIWNEDLDAREKEARVMAYKARQVGDDLQGYATDIAGHYQDSFVTPINYKSHESIVRKSYTEGEAPSDLKDTVRTTIIVPKDSIGSVLDELKQVPGFMRVKVQTPDQFLGYSGNIVNVRMSNGVVGEIQVNTAKMIYAKEKPSSAKAILGEGLWNEIARLTGEPGGLGHEVYELLRVLPTGSVERLMLEEESRRYYAHFQ